jgi:hypothetical protein
MNGNVVPDDEKKNDWLHLHKMLKEEGVIKFHIYFLYA